MTINKGSSRHEWLWTPDFTDVEDQSADLNAGMASLTGLGFIWAAIRRSMRWCLAIAVLGMLIGAGYYLSSPPSYQASTTLLLTNGPEEAPGSAIADDQAIAQSRAVAGLALGKLRLRESVNSFLASYTVTPLTDRVLVLTVNAPSSREAVSRANALATSFLRYRGSQLQIQQRLLIASLDEQVTQGKQHVTSLSRQIRQLSAQPGQRAALGDLRAERRQALGALTELEHSVNTAAASSQQVTTSQIQQSQVLDRAAAVPPPSRLKHMVLYGAFGFIGGLVLALAIVVIRALTSDRLRRRDDIARALGAPVKLSVGKIPLSRWRPGRRGLAAAKNARIQRIVAHLGNTAAARSRSTVALAVVPVDGPEVPAMSLVSLAMSFAGQMRLRVMLADLCSTTPAARLLGVTEAGVRMVNVDGVRLAVAVPDRGDATPVGPLPPKAARAHFPPCGEELANAFAGVDVLLTLAVLDPAVGGDHLATWADAAVAMVTAGQSSWTRIRAASEMIRLAGVRLVSGVLVGADKTDESLGVAPVPGAGDDSGNTGKGLPDGGRFFTTVDESPGGAPSGDR